MATNRKILIRQKSRQCKMRGITRKILGLIVKIRQYRVTKIALQTQISEQLRFFEHGAREFAANAQ
jgi:hypothetical protein